jgi:hypothetical protein
LIHQFIFAGPKPGLSPEAFQNYWINFHAVDYAAKIRQIRQYLVATRLPLTLPRQLPFFEGVAEIWLANDAEQLASMQSAEFLQGARADEPRWAAFWQTLGIDTDPHMVREASGLEPGTNLVKLYLLLKRRPGSSRQQFHDDLLASRQPPVTGSVRNQIGFARSVLYGVGEPRFDAVEVLAFATEQDLKACLAGPFGTSLREGWTFLDRNHLFAFAAQDHWVIRPGER